jgi:hypothetical protein
MDVVIQLTDKTCVTLTQRDRVHICEHWKCNEAEYMKKENQIDA